MIFTHAVCQSRHYIARQMLRMLRTNKVVMAVPDIAGMRTLRVGFAPLGAISTTLPTSLELSLRFHILTFVFATRGRTLFKSALPRCPLTIIATDPIQLPTKSLTMKASGTPKTRVYGSTIYSDGKRDDEDKSNPWMVAAVLEKFTTPPKNRIITSSHGSLIIRFRSPAAHRLQMRSVSCGIWMPQEARVGTAESLSFMAAQAPTTPSLAIALDIRQ